MALHEQIVWFMLAPLVPSLSASLHARSIEIERVRWIVAVESLCRVSPSSDGDESGTHAYCTLGSMCGVHSIPCDSCRAFTLTSQSVTDLLVG
jgi:hypothetical protein